MSTTFSEFLMDYSTLLGHWLAFFSKCPRKYISSQTIDDDDNNDDNDDDEDNNVVGDKVAAADDINNVLVMLEKKKAKKKKLTKDKRVKALQMYALLSNVLMLVEITLILPLSTAFCERGFSVMGKIKSDWKSCLSVEVLHCLMRIRIEGTSVAEFNPQPGVQFWWDSGTRMRRPTFND
ncbi:hypothetical protein ACROYT_G019284 [Oculina patagonica]